jgi:hypothetical protein
MNEVWPALLLLLVAASASDTARFRIHYAVNEVDGVPARGGAHESAAGDGLAKAHRQLAASSKLDALSPMAVLFPHDGIARDFIVAFSSESGRDDALIKAAEAAEAAAAVAATASTATGVGTAVRGLEVVQLFSAGVVAAHVTATAAAVAALCAHEDVVSVEEDRMVFSADEVDEFVIDERDIVYDPKPDLVGDMVPGAAVSSDSVLAQGAATKQSNAPWAVDRVDQISRPLDSSYSYDTDGTDVDGAPLCLACHVPFANGAHRGVRPVCTARCAASRLPPTVYLC